jgi:uncharacterized membrane protein (DUF485 family)
MHASLDTNGSALRRLARLRWRIAVTLSAVMVFIYFGFILLVAFSKQALSTLIVPGLSLGIVLGASVILLSFLVTWIYVRWMGSHVDTEIRRLRGVGDPQ